MIEKGLISFINTKLESDISPTHIKRMLAHAGVKESDVEEAFAHIKSKFSDSHRHEVARNDFLPPLKKNHEAHDEENGLNHQHHQDHQGHHDPKQKGLFKGRLRRKDFILGFIFFFAIGYTLLAFGVALLSIFYPTVWAQINNALIQDDNGMFLIFIPVILAPITIMMLSLITRRLHNLGMSGSLSILFLSVFVLPAVAIPVFGKTAIFIALAVLFIILITKKGSTAPNMYGALPPSRGSFFKRIFNI